MIGFLRRQKWRAWGWLHRQDPSSSNPTAAQATTAPSPTAQPFLWADELVERVRLFENPEADDFVSAYPKYLNSQRAPLLALQKQLADLLADARGEVNNAWAEFPDLINRVLQGHPLERPPTSLNRKE